MPDKDKCIVGLSRKKPLEEESGYRISTFELARVRKNARDVLDKIDRRYRWQPDASTRRVLCRTNWVARLSALLNLARRHTCNHVDLELQEMLKHEGNRRLDGKDVIARFDQWYKLEDGSGVKVRAFKKADHDKVVRTRRMYAEYVSDPSRRIGP